MKLGPPADNRWLAQSDNFDAAGTLLSVEALGLAPFSSPAEVLGWVVLLSRAISGEAYAVAAPWQADGAAQREVPVDDPRIYSEVRRRVVVEPATPKKAIFVDVVNGNVTLRGMVFSLEARDEAVRAAEKTEGVKAVRDLLKVNAPLL
ncbi:MAG: BON domain-containing protein [Acidobacteria bacterium]|nr:BON domain-containing protein [Acidobacteriota bacterium]MCI0624701.1 BON domain-containing protein [Acidobacteriota bacterium]